jgi:cytochrome P450/NADPH-cytochrome P450 reductase
MIGPGTGIAPFRGFLQQRDLHKRDGAKLGEALLFFGCRHPDHDFLYRDELERYESEGIASLFTAFSREANEPSYVQHVIERQADRVWELIEAGARVYVCGDGAAMEPDVRRTLVSICANKRQCGLEEAQAWIDQMSDEERYLLDVWVG